MVVTEQNITNFLDDLGGEEREIIPADSTMVDNLMDLLNYLLNNENVQKINNTPLYDSLYKELYRVTREKITDLTLKDLESFLLTSSQMDLSYDDILIRGNYSGALLNILSDLNEDNT
ncbi:hypothetical protein ACFL1H_07690, partial [Nanoarchaeota archaeon]